MSLKNKRLEQGLTLEEVGDYVGVGKSTVRKWENGDIQNLKRDKIAKLAEILKINPLAIVYDDYSYDQSSNILNVYSELNDIRKQKVYNFAKDQYDEQINTVDETSSIYLVGDTAAGKGLEYTQLNAEQINTHVPKGADYALTVRGDSMEPLIEDGDIIFYKEVPVVENGEIAIVEIEGESVTCKKLYLEDDKIILKSINDKYEDMIFEDNVRVIGKVIL